VQIKLLRVLQERTFSAVGGHDLVRFHGRVIAATNRPVDELRANGRFRDDFYYRLCSDVIELPSLKQRVEEDPAELALLVAFIVRRILGEDSVEICELVTTAIAKDVGAGYAWPGNVRELEQCVRRVILTQRYAGDRVVRGGAEGARVGAVGKTDESVRGVVSRHCRALHARYGTYEEVARRAGIDRRTVKRYVEGEE
jgi:DNA-binding NtrC family response regulator